MLNLTRWICFFLFKPLDYLVLLAEWLYLPYFYYKVVDRSKLLETSPRMNTPEYITSRAKSEPLDENGFTQRDAHTLICELGNGLINKGLREDLISKMVTKKGSLLRRYPDNQSDPSGDCLASWITAYTLWGIDRPDLLKKLGTQFLKHCFALEWEAHGGAAGRSSMSGVMPAYGPFPSGESWWKSKIGICQPMTSASFYTTLGFLGLLRAKLGGMWTLVYWAYYFLNLGPLRRFTPMMHGKGNEIYYLHHVLAMNLWVLNKNLGGFEYQLKYVCKKISPKGSLQPWIAGWGVDAGALDEEDRKRTLQVLLAIDGAESWPQHMAITPGFYRGTDSGWTNMYLALVLLKGNK